MFENTAIGKQTSIISDENGSKLVLISGAAQPVIKVEQLKGKEQTPEALEVDLTTLIDIKGMKAMGNRLSQHTIKKVELIAEIEPEEESVDELDGDLEQDEVISESPDTVEKEEPPVKETKIKEPESPIEKAPEQPVKSSEKSDESPDSVEQSPKPVESPQKPVEPVIKKIDFEITNPDDIDIDDKGQLGLF